MISLLHVDLDVDSVYTYLGKIHIESVSFSLLHLMDIRLLAHAFSLVFGCFSSFYWLVVVDYVII